VKREVKIDDIGALEKKDQNIGSIDKSVIEDEIEEKKSEDPLATVAEVFFFAKSSKAKLLRSYFQLHSHIFQMALIQTV